MVAREAIAEAVPVPDAESHDDAPLPPRPASVSPGPAWDEHVPDFSASDHAEPVSMLPHAAVELAATASDVLAPSPRRPQTAAEAPAAAALTLRVQVPGPRPYTAPESEPIPWVQTLQLVGSLTARLPALPARPSSRGFGGARAGSARLHRAGQGGSSTARSAARALSARATHAQARTCGGARVSAAVQHMATELLSNAPMPPASPRPHTARPDVFVPPQTQRTRAGASASLGASSTPARGGSMLSSMLLSSRVDLSVDSRAGVDRHQDRHENTEAEPWDAHDHPRPELRPINARPAIGSSGSSSSVTTPAPTSSGRPQPSGTFHVLQNMRVDGPASGGAIRTIGEQMAATNLARGRPMNPPLTGATPPDRTGAMLASVVAQAQEEVAQALHRSRAGGSAGGARSSAGGTSREDAGNISPQDDEARASAQRGHLTRRPASTYPRHLQPRVVLEEERTQHPARTKTQRQREWETYVSSLHQSRKAGSEALEKPPRARSQARESPGESQAPASPVQPSTAGKPWAQDEQEGQHMDMVMEEDVDAPCRHCRGAAAARAPSKPSGSKPSGSKPSGSKPSGSKPSGSKPSGGGPRDFVAENARRPPRSAADTRPSFIAQTFAAMDALERLHKRDLAEALYRLDLDENGLNASRVARVLYGGKRKELEEHILVQIGRSNLRDVQGCMKVHGLERPTQAVERLGWQAQSDSLG